MPYSSRCLQTPRHRRNFPTTTTEPANNKNRLLRDMMSLNETLRWSRQRNNLRSNPGVRQTRRTRRCRERYIGLALTEPSYSRMMDGKILGNSECSRCRPSEYAPSVAGEEHGSQENGYLARFNKHRSALEQAACAKKPARRGRGKRSGDRTGGRSPALPRAQPLRRTASGPLPDRDLVWVGARRVSE
jgi:hypothetical protein